MGWSKLHRVQAWVGGQTTDKADQEQFGQHDDSIPLKHSKDGTC
ncbi:hypothetical protein RISK_005980 [Rhodopirellula islandica]|uniref:Uncharacterized protein n=1 Tax=Rhodopirellula islandica TaxID=595434 RepID=A0A0J1B5L6_RHOIS|nr:hypothetical protein RISK_005980 [Rhodopirellula islandica]